MGQTCGRASLEGTSEEINLQVENLEAKIARAEMQIRQYVAAAGTDPAAKQRALQLMRRKKVFEEQRQQLIGAQFNVDSLADQEEQARYTVKAVEAMQVGRDRLKKNQEKMSANQVDRLLDDASELADEMKAINESLAQGSGLLELESEYAQLQREIMGVGTGAAVPRAQAEPQLQQRKAQQQRQQPQQQQRQPQQLSAATRQSSRASSALESAGHWKQQSGELQQKPWESEMPPPPPPPPPRRNNSSSNASIATTTVDEEYANAWAASALKAAMAPYGHLPGAGPNALSFQHEQQRNRRIPMAA